MAEQGVVVSQLATTYIGVIPYHLGASMQSTTNLTAADCSSFIKYLYSAVGVDLPRTADNQYKQTQDKSIVNPTTANLKPGDLLFFGGYDTPDNVPGYAGIQHVAMYVGNGNVIDEGGANPNNVGTTKLSNYTVNGTDHLIAATRPLAKAGDTGVTLSGPGSPGYIPGLGGGGAIGTEKIGGLQGGLINTGNDVGAALDPLAQVAAFLGKLTNPANWLHGAAMLAGAGMIAFGVWTAMKNANDEPAASSAPSMPIILKEGA